MNTIFARKIIENSSPSKLWDMITGDKVNVIFDDGSVIMSGTEVILTSYVWWFNFKYKDIPVNKDSYIRNFFINGSFHSGTPDKMYHYALFNTFNYISKQESRKINGLVGVPDNVIYYDHLLRDLTILNNVFYNDVVKNTKGYVKGLHIFDFIDIAESDEFVAIRKESSDNGDRAEDIDKLNTDAETAIRKGIMTKDYKTGNYVENPLSWYARIGVAKMNQSIQATVARGYTYEIDKEKIDHCITTNLTEGINTVTDYCVLSRESALPLSSATDDLSMTTYDGRRLSYVAAYRNRVHYGDCGTNRLMRSPLLIEDVNGMIGSMFVPPDEPDILRPFVASDKKYVGEMIERRSAMLCGLQDQGKICSVCIGELAKSMPPNINIGISLAKAFSSILVQLTMSLKHVISSMSTSGENDNVVKRKFLRFRDNKYFMIPINNAKKIEVYINGSDIFNVSDILTTDSANTIAGGRVSAIGKVRFFITRVNKHMEGEVTIGSGKNKSMMSYELLLYIKDNVERMKKRNNEYVIDITDFDRKNPLFTKALMMDSYRDKSRKVVQALERVGATEKELNEFDKGEIISRLFDMTKADGNISMAGLEILLSAYLADSETGRLSRGGDEVYHSKSDNCVSSRSLSVAFIHNRGARYLYSPGAFLRDYRENSPWDVLASPDEVLK